MGVGDLGWVEEVQFSSQGKCVPLAHPKPNAGGFITQAVAFYSTGTPEAETQV